MDRYFGAFEICKYPHIEYQSEIFYNSQGGQEKALESLPLDNLNLLIIENVGNLVCPAEFALGEHKKVMLLSTPEGDDKPFKYPLMFTEADVVLINKIDLLPYVNFNITAFKHAVTGLNQKARIFPISCKTGEGLETWFSWLETEIKKKKNRTKAPKPIPPKGKR